MKVWIGRPRCHWLSPYTILKHICFWASEDDIYEGRKYKKAVKVLDKFSEALQWVLDKLHPEIKLVKIDNHDIWGMDYTLAYLILPMLKKMKENKQGSPLVDDEDVPDALNEVKPNWDPTQDHWDKYVMGFEMRWAHVLNEMIFAFECKLNNNSEDPFFDEYYRVKDHEVYKAHLARVSRGFLLFGKYYEALWT